jgi:hypothetical protein
VSRELVERVARPLAGRAVAPVVVGAAHPASSVSPLWEKPPLEHSTFRSATARCGPFGGSGGDHVTNERKNRADAPTRYHAVAFDAIGDTTRLPFPHGTRARWTAGQTAFVARFEGIPVAVVGYIDVIHPGSRESTNCDLGGEANTDWHVALVRGRGNPESSAVVVEPTPRMKQLHHGRWSTGRLRRYVRPQSPGDSVRISGYLLMDPAHPGDVGVRRGTLWEIHPVTGIEVFRDGAWRDLEDEP